MAKDQGTDFNDRIRGTNKDDVIDAGKGNDYVAGRKGDDDITAGLGNDVVHGGEGRDTLKGDAPGEFMFKTDLITMAEDHQVKVTFDFEEAGYRNTLGVYKVDPETGTIKDVQVMWENASLRGSGGDLEGGKSSYSFDVAEGEQIGFFLVGNGFSRNNFAKMGEGSFKFVKPDGSPATVDDTGVRLVHESAGGKQTVINGPIYHTAAFGDRAKLNSDRIEHTMGYKKGDDGTIQIGFEDLWKGGDRDFDDAVFTVDIGKASVEVLNKHYQTTLKEATETADASSWGYMDANDTNDRLEGGADADNIDGMQGNDLLAGGGAGAEWKLVDGQWVYDPSAIGGGKPVKLDQSDDVITGDTGDDVLLGGGGNDTLDGGAGDDRINAGSGDDLARGGDGDDTINLEAGNDYAEGGAGNDTINAGSGDDVAHGGAGDDKLRGGDGDDRLFGDAGKDTLHGGSGDDTLDGGEGADKLFGGAGDDHAAGGAGDDYVEGGAGNDTLDGGAGADRVMGGAGDDTLSGGAGNDKIVGGSGADRIEGGAGNDHLWGGNWSSDGQGDTFAFAPGAGKDMIHDFEVGTDQIDLSAYGLSYEELAARMTDKGWATEIDLSGLPGAGGEEKIIIKSVHVDDLDESSFQL